MENFEIKKEVKKIDFQTRAGAQKIEQLEQINDIMKGAFNSLGVSRTPHIEKILLKIYEDKIDNKEIFYESDVKKYIRDFRNKMNDVLVIASEYNAAYVVDGVLDRLEHDNVKDEKEILDNIALYAVEVVKEYGEEVGYEEERKNDTTIENGVGAVGTVAIVGGTVYGVSKFAEKSAIAINKIYSKEMQKTIEETFNAANAGDKNATYSAKEMEKITNTLLNGNEMKKDSRKYRAALARIMKLYAAGSVNDKKMAVGIAKQHFSDMVPGLISKNVNGEDIVNVLALEKEMQRTNKVNGIEDSVYNDFNKVKLLVEKQKAHVKPLKENTSLSLQVAKNMERADKTQKLMTLRYGRKAKNPAKKQKYKELLEEIRDYPELAQYLRSDILKMTENPNMSQDEKQALYEMILVIDTISKDKEKAEDLMYGESEEVVDDVLEENTTNVMDLDDGPEL